MCSEGYSTWSVCLSVSLCVCYHVFRHHMHQTGQKATPTGSALHLLDFKSGDFCKNTAVKSYGVKTKMNMPIFELEQAYLDRLLCVS